MIGRHTDTFTTEMEFISPHCTVRQNCYSRDALGAKSYRYYPRVMSVPFGECVDPVAAEVDIHSWSAICAKDTNGCPGREYLVKGLFEPLGYEVMVSDGVTVWEEKKESQEILERLKVEELGLRFISWG